MHILWRNEHGCNTYIVSNFFTSSKRFPLLRVYSHKLFHMFSYQLNLGINGECFFVICIIKSHLLKTHCWFIIMCLRHTVSCKTIQQRSYLKSNTWVICLYDKVSWKWLMELWSWLVKMNTANNCFKDIQVLPKYFNVFELIYTDVLSG